VQLACNNGREILSIRNLGAGRCAGFDISARFIAEGRELAAAGNIDCELVACDAYEIPDEYNGRFDVAFISVGALVLLPDLPVLFAVPARLLRPGGTLFLYERHPVLDLFDHRDEGDPPAICDSYFRTEPLEIKMTINYWTREEYATPSMYAFHHTLADVVNAAIGNGFRITWFEEYPHDISEIYAHFAAHRHKLPLSYALTATLEGRRP
jgi:SAM-dependent methyltransferase